jgi:hypothetical protein
MLCIRLRRNRASQRRVFRLHLQGLKPHGESREAVNDAFPVGTREIYAFVSIATARHFVCADGEHQTCYGVLIL